MIIIGYVDLLPGFDELDVYRYQQLFSDSENERILRFKNPKDACLCIYGKLLLQYLAAKFNLGSVDLRMMQSSEYKKPVLPSNEKVSFNISHSNNVVMTVITIENVVGVDIEHVNSIVLDDFKNIFPEPVYREITNAPDSLTAFYHYWTKYEAALKAHGTGFFTELGMVKLYTDHAIVDERKWYLQNFSLLPGYVCHIATGKPDAFVYPVKCEPEVFREML